MGIEYEQDKLDELLRLTKENNKMLRAQRRSAWVAGIFRLIVWAAVIVIPVWFYMEYLAPKIESVLQTYQQVQGASAQAQAQFGQINEYMKQLQQIPGLGR